MPIEIHDDGDDSIDVRPGTNEARVLAVLAKHPDTAFTKGELAERAGIKQTSIYKTVDRLLEKGLVDWHADGRHVHVDQDRRDAIYRRLRSFKDATTLERLFDDDYFAENQDWADDLPDLGRERLPQQDAEAGQDADAEHGAGAEHDANVEHDTETGQDDHEGSVDDIAEMPDLDE